MTVSPQHDVIVVGAGLAGLRAARDLADAGRQRARPGSPRPGRRTRLDLDVPRHRPGDRGRRWLVHRRSSTSPAKSSAATASASAS